MTHKTRHNAGIHSGETATSVCYITTTKTLLQTKALFFSSDIITREIEHQTIQPFFTMKQDVHLKAKTVTNVPGAANGAISPFAALIRLGEYILILLHYMVFVL